MPTYSIDGPDGKTYSIDGPAGASRDQVIAKIKEQMPGPSLAHTAGEFAKGAARGLTEGADFAFNYLTPFGGIRRNVESLGGPHMPTAEETAERVVPIKADPQNTTERYVGTVGEFAGNPLSYMGPGGLLVKGAGAVVGGLGSEAGGELAESAGLGSTGQTIARAVGGGVGSAVVGTAAMERGLSQLSKALPTKDAIKASAKTAYDMVATARLKVAQPAIDQFAADMRTALDNDLIVESVAPRTFRAIEQLQKAGGDVAQIMGIRQRLGNVLPSAGTDYHAAGMVKNAIDDFIEKLDPAHVVAGDPKFTQAMLDHARSSWRAYRKLDEVEQAGELALHRAQATGTGANYINTARQEIRKILDSDSRSRGYSPEAKEQMEKIVLGTWATNQSRYLSKFAPTGPVSATTSILTGMGGGVEAGVAVAGTGFLAKYLGQYLTNRQLRELEDIIRSESPLGQVGAAGRAGQAAELRSLPAASALRGGAAGAVSPLASPLQ